MHFLRYEPAVNRTSDKWSGSLRSKSIGGFSNHWQNKHDKEICWKFEQNVYMLNRNSHNSVNNNAMDLGQSLKDTYWS